MGGPETIVKINREPVPVQHCPLDPATSATIRLRDKRFEQGITGSLPAILREDEQVLKKECRTRKKAGVGLEHECVTYRLVTRKRKACFDARVRPEHIGNQPLLCLCIGRSEVFVLRKRFDQPKQVG
jgi:hypothetical protein